MERSIYFNDTYFSGIEGCPGAQFIIDLKNAPEPVDSEEEAVKGIGTVRDDTQASDHLSKSSKSNEARGHAMPEQATSTSSSMATVSVSIHTDEDKKLHSSTRGALYSLCR